MVDAAALRKLIRGDAPAPDRVRRTKQSAPVGRLIDLTSRRLRIFSRNDVCYIASRAWRADAKAAGIAALRAEKRQPDHALTDAAAAEIAADIRALLGAPAFIVAPIACGHSRTPHCWGCRLAQAVAAALDVPYVKLFSDRFTSGSSHPQENAGLPPLEWIARPSGPVLVVDDVATSGWHLEEALTRIRAEGVPAVGIAWISGGTKS